MNQEFRDRFAALHVPGEPVLLYNIWDVGSAKAVAAGGALALATGSHCLAEANGFPDGEGIPFNLFLDCIRRIVAGVALPVGCNFEDQEVGGPGLHPIAEQAHRVAAVVESGLWVNARTDLFLRKLIAGENANDRSLLGEALERAQAYAEAGAHSFFVPGITDLELIAEICAAAPLPVNVIKPAEHDFPALAAAGVARISWGPRPWIWAMARLTEEAKALYAAR